MTTSLGHRSPGAQRRKDWRVRLGERGLVEKKVMIRAADAELFVRLVERTRTGESLGDVLYDLASKAAPPAAPLPAGGVFDMAAQAANDGTEADAETCSRDVWILASGPETEAEYRVARRGIAVILSGGPVPPAYRFKEVERRAAPPDRAHGGHTVQPPIEPVGRLAEVPVRLAASAAPPVPSKVPAGDLVRAREPAAPVEPPGAGGSGAEMSPPSWRRAEAGGRIDRWRGRAVKIGNHARRTVSPALFFAVAVAVALFIASIAIYAFKPPTVEAGDTELPPAAEAAAIAAAPPVDTSTDDHARRLASLEAENRWLADHLEALLAELDQHRSARPAAATMPRKGRPAKAAHPTGKAGSR